MTKEPMRKYIDVSISGITRIVITDIVPPRDGLLLVPDVAQLLVLWDHGDYVFYKESQGYFPGDVEWDWRHSSENVETLRAGAHANARIVWDAANESNKLTSSS